MPSKGTAIKTWFSLCTCAGGADEGARQAGLEDLGGIEINPAYAAIARLNGFNPTVADICYVDFSKLSSPDWLHASPPCVNASVANLGAVESDKDGAISSAVIRAIAQLRPKIFSLENVAQYKEFEAFSKIKDELKALGYTSVHRVLNSVEYGVPQSRSRLFLVASRIGRPQLPAPTHSLGRQLDFLLQPANGWASAIKPTMAEEYQLSERMAAMVPSSLTGRTLMSGWQHYAKRGATGLTVRREHQPAPTIISRMQQPSTRPMIIEHEGGKTVARVLNLRGMAALQTFPESYQWGNSHTIALECIGNAVSPRLMKQIIEANSR